MTRKLFFFSIHVLLPLFLGGLVYILWRDPNLLMFRWLGEAGLGPAIDWLRVGAASAQTVLPHWFIYSLPDGLWVYALTALRMFVWRGVHSLPLKIFWLSLGLVIGVGGELAQLAGILPGAFDPIDLVVCLIAPAAALWLTPRGLILNRSLDEAS